MHRASSTPFFTILQGNSFGVLFELPAILDSFFTSTTGWLAGGGGEPRSGGEKHVKY